MPKKPVSNYYFKSIYLLTPKKVAEIGAKTLIVDLDNTLAPYYEMKPTRRTYEFISSFLNAGIEIIIVSNNTYKRTYPYVSLLGLSFLSSAHKPFKGKLKKYLVSHSFNLSKCLYIGDQVINDMFMARKIGLKRALVEPISPKDHISAKVMRPVDRWLRKKYKKQGRLGINLFDENEKEASI